MSRIENLRTLARFDAMVEARDASRLEEVCTPGMVNHTLAPGRPGGVEGTREFLETQARSFQPDGWEELQVVADDDHVVQFGVRGGHWDGGSFHGYDLPAGTYRRDFVAMYRFEEGKIAERWAVRDDLTMIEQLRDGQG